MWPGASVEFGSDGGRTLWWLWQSKQAATLERPRAMALPWTLRG